MRSSILLITIALFCFIGFSAQQCEGCFESVTNAEVYSDPDAKGALNFGAKQIAKKAIAAKKIPNYVYSVSRLLSAEEQVVAGMNYQFHAYIHDARNRVILDAYYTVYEDLDGKYSLSQSRYKILKGAQKIL